MSGKDIVGFQSESGRVFSFSNIFFQAKRVFEGTYLVRSLNQFDPSSKMTLFGPNMICAEGKMVPICCDSTKTMDNLDGLLLFGNTQRFHAKEIKRNSNLYKFLEALQWTDVRCSGRGKDSNQSLVESFQTHFSTRKQTI